MDSGFDKQNNFWEDTLSYFSLFCADDRKPDALKNSDEALDPQALSPQPRSLASSEFSDQSMVGVTEIQNWTQADDSKLIKLVFMHDYDWRIVSKSFPKFSKTDLQKRWEIINTKNSKHCYWKKEEDELIVELYNTYNGNWKKIAEIMNGRSLGALKNRYYGVLKKRSNKVQPEKNPVEDDQQNNKTSDTFSDDKPTTIEERVSIPLNCLTEEEKRIKINDLYNKMLILQSKIEKTKKKIEKIKS
jgi:predicted acyl esterase